MRVFRPLTQPFIQGNVNNTQSSRQQGTSFAAELNMALKTTQDRLTISKHAQQRLEQRGISINEARWEQIDERVKQAKSMGVKESLVLLEDAALIVSAKNNTVITAMNREEASTQIFTNINGTILLD
ncbi:TIGR02530 family flagellar biosynthesis protein [Bacillus tuaregi]|uniref:TIGR02530 family flagellar biosynthesis protein n=1 Tax=Bacillus tuaregi TaxID=1816695 RepID=UPI0008F870EC|nr:TIGR02530 family flagellar biosynthesis protein [Bacillus tuaregi]